MTKVDTILKMTGEYGIMSKAETCLEEKRGDISGCKDVNFESIGIRYNLFYKRNARHYIEGEALHR